MKKRCTNSACRKMFTFASVCPHCGKEYPRLSVAEHKVRLTYYGKNKVFVVKALIELNPKLTIQDAVNKVKRVPCIVGDGLSYFEAKSWRKKIEGAGGDATIE